MFRRLLSSHPPTSPPEAEPAATYAEALVDRVLERLIESTPDVESMFDPLDVRPYGGTILHMLFHEIAHNFCSDDPETKQWLQACFDTEDSLISAGELTSDFMAGVYTKRNLS